ncbi:hypothetical protein CBW24_00980 [Pacificitalea manganoxidans]|uniref:Bacterial sugar transferase domain-containing protein n=1 Tax=Pacificitalea manganoxidans TaxID=1411902 RepID=A0A291LVQ9_9RHOB|nr:hypothetical protein CBW24_00980 [Pacificitalea manganoxidans]
MRRSLDLTLALLLIPVVVPLAALVALALLATQGRPLLFVSERMRSVDEGFSLIKFRTMEPSATLPGPCGGGTLRRVTPLGLWLRRSRLDELPQLWNILRGDMCFIGPRPPLRQHVTLFQDDYRSLLADGPGLTGLATLTCYRWEERLLARSSSALETEQIYLRQCLPRKLRIDRLHQARRSLRWDLWLMICTVLRHLPPCGRARRQATIRMASSRPVRSLKPRSVTALPPPKSSTVDPSTMVAWAAITAAPSVALPTRSADRNRRSSPSTKSSIWSRPMSS